MPLGVQTVHEPTVAEEVTEILSQHFPSGYVSLTAQEAARGRATVIIREAED